MAIAQATELLAKLDDALTRTREPRIEADRDFDDVRRMMAYEFILHREGGSWQWSFYEGRTHFASPPN